METSKRGVMQHLTKYYYCLTFLVFVYGLLAARVWLKSVVTVWPVQSVQGMRLMECNVVVSQLGIVCGRHGTALQSRGRWALFCSTLIVDFAPLFCWSFLRMDPADHCCTSRYPFAAEPDRELAKEDIYRTH